MADFFEALDDGLIEFIEKQHLFFVGTAAADGRVNVSPKGMDSLRVTSPTEIVWLNFTGSGNETAAHILDTNRMTLMFCSFDRQPLILRCYGTADLIYPRHEEDWQACTALFGEQAGARQYYRMQVELVQTSCGFAVPFYEFAGERDTLANWFQKKGTDGLEGHWASKNSVSIDGKPTHIVSD